MSNHSEIVLPIMTYQRHISTYSSSEIEPIIFVNSARKDVRRIYSVLTQPIHTIQNAPSAATPATVAANVFTPAVEAGVAVQQPRFLKGSSDTAQICTRFLHRYQDRQYPENYVTATVDGAGNVVDQTNLLAHMLTNIAPDKTKNSPYIASLSAVGVSDVHSVFEDEFVIVQDFRSSDDKNVINALNMNLNSSPLIIEMKMNQVDTSGKATNVNSYLELSSEVVIEHDGGMSIVSKAAL